MTNLSTTGATPNPPHPTILSAAGSARDHATPEPVDAERMRRSCSRCGGTAILSIPYSGQRLCKSHFIEFFEQRVKHEIRAQGPYPGDEKLAVAVSGGKDSIVTLRLLQEIMGERRGFQLICITIDEGIAGYRPEGMRVAKATAEELGLPFHTTSYKDLVGKDLDTLVADAQALPSTPTACGICGPLRRRALNAAAQAVGARKLATGHNLDDMAQTVLLNILRGDVAAIGRMAPHATSLPGYVRRIVPLRTIPEREVALYAFLRGFTYHDGECPHSGEAERGHVREMLLDLEERTPGTRHRLLAARDRMAALVAAGESAGVKS
ncbi:MAG: ATP-binding protein [Thermoplasmatota archaeon]